VNILSTKFKGDFDEVWQIIKEIGTSERHFNGLQHQYRVLASTWILAVFAAAGFILINNEAISNVLPIEIAISGLALVGAVGITLLWIIDLRVYQLLLRDYFDAGVKLEQEHTWLPQIRTRMLQKTYGHGVASYVALFYLSANAALLFLGDLFLIFYSSHKWEVGLLVGLVIVVWTYVLHRSTPVRPLLYGKRTDPNAPS